jgi:hypothetical protein
VYGNCVEDREQEFVTPADGQTLRPQSSGAIPPHITIRQVTPHHALPLIRLLSRLSDQTHYRRYFRPAPRSRNGAHSPAGGGSTALCRHATLL